MWTCGRVPMPTPPYGPWPHSGRGCRCWQVRARPGARGRGGVSGRTPGGGGGVSGGSGPHGPAHVLPKQVLLRMFGSGDCSRAHVQDPGPALSSPTVPPPSMHTLAGQMDSARLQHRQWAGAWQRFGWLPEMFELQTGTQHPKLDGAQRVAGKFGNATCCCGRGMREEESVCVCVCILGPCKPTRSGSWPSFPFYTTRRPSSATASPALPSNNSPPLLSNSFPAPPHHYQPPPQTTCCGRN